MASVVALLKVRFAGDGCGGAVVVAVAESDFGNYAVSEIVVVVVAEVQPLAAAVAFVGDCRSEEVSYEHTDQAQSVNHCFHSAETQIVAGLQKLDMRIGDGEEVKDAGDLCMKESYVGRIEMMLHCGETGETEEVKRC